MYPLSTNAFGSRTSPKARTGADNPRKKRRAHRALRAAAIIESLETRTHLSVTHSASTYFGGSGDDVFRDAVVAPDGSVYLAGASLSADLSLPAGGYDRTANGAGDVLLVHLSADLSTVLHATLLGGSGWEKNTYGIGLDNQGNVYVAGETRSTNFPTTAGARQRGFGGGLNDAFVAKLSGDLSTLHYSTYLGGSGDDAARGGLAVDPASGQVTVVGWTGSTNFPTTSGSYQSTYRGGTYDGFVTRLSADGGSLLWSTFVGGSFGTAWNDSEYVVGAVLGGDGSVYFTGASTSSDFPTTAGAYDRTHNGNGVADAFVGRLSADGKSLLWSTLLGGNGGGEFTEHRMAVDGAGNVVVVGTAASSDFPVTTGRSHGGGPNDIFVAKVAAGGGSLLWSTLVGGAGEDSGFGPVIAGVGGDVFVAGPSTSTNFPVTADALQRTNGGGQDAVLVRLDGGSGRLEYATYLGGSGDDFVRFLAGDAGGNLYLTGETKSANYPVTGGAADGSYGGGGAYDAFVTRVVVDDGGQATPAEIEVRRGATGISDGQGSAVSFGSVTQGTAAVDVTFTVSNTGGSTLILGSVTLSSNTGFSVVSQPSTSVAPGGSTTFVLRMSTGSAGSKSANVSFTNSDSDESPFNFSVAGTVTLPPPEVQVLRGATNISDGSTTPVSFGSVQQGAAAPRVTFTINNTGAQTLTLGSVTLSNNSGFSVITQPAGSVAAGGSTTFVLEMATGSTGSMGADVSFTNNDSNENPFNFKLAGTVTVATGISVSAGADGTATEGGAYSGNGGFTPGSVGAAWTATVDYGDGSGAQALSLAGDHSFSLDHAYADNGVYTVTVIVSDDAGGADTDTLTVTVSSAAPVSTAGGDTNGVQGQRRTVTFGATDASSADGAAGFSYKIDWGDGTPLESFAAGAVKARHAFAAPGEYAVRVRAIDKDGVKGPYVTHTIVVKKAELQQDPTSSSKMALVVGGTPGADEIRLVRRSDGTIKVFIDDVSAGSFAPTGRVIANGWDGNDTITADAVLGFATMLFGDSGNDTLAGGEKADALVGGSGKDVLRGGGKRDLVIGGKSADRLFGGDDEDLLVGGATRHDGKHRSLAKLLKEWGRKDVTYAERAAHVRGSTAGGLNGAIVLDAAGATDDGAADALMGEAGVDALWLNTDAGVLDTRADRVSGEKAYDVD